MYHGSFCRLLSATEDQFIQRRIGSGTVADAITDWRLDAATPAQLDALAFQLRCCIDRSTDAFLSEPWIAGLADVERDAADARARLARHPSRTSHPGFFSNRSVGRPGLLDDDLFLPLAFELDLSGQRVPEVFSGSYQPTLREGVLYRTRGSRDGFTWLEWDLPTAIKVSNNTLRMLLNLGRIVARPLSAMQRAA